MEVSDSSTEPSSSHRHHTQPMQSRSLARKGLALPSSTATSKAPSSASASVAVLAARKLSTTSTTSTTTTPNQTPPPASATPPTRRRNSLVAPSAPASVAASADKPVEQQHVTKNRPASPVVRPSSPRILSVCACGAKCQKCSVEFLSTANTRSATTASKLSSSAIPKSVHSRTPSQRWSMSMPSTNTTTSTTSTLSASITSSKSPIVAPSSSAIDRIASSPNTTGYTVFTSPKLSAARSSSPGVGPHNNLFIQQHSPSLSSIGGRKRTSSISMLGTSASSLSSSLELTSLLTGSHNPMFLNPDEQEAALEKEFCKDFWCCGLVLDDLHELNRHIQEFHPEMSPMTQGDNTLLGGVVGLDALFLNDLIPAAAAATLSDNSDTAVDSLSPGTTAVSPKQSFFTPPTSLSPEMSPKSSSALASLLTFDADPEILFPFGDSSSNDFCASILPPRRRDSHDTLAVDDETTASLGLDKVSTKLEDLLSFDDDIFSDTNPVASMFEDSIVGVDILNRLGRIELHQQQQQDEALEQSLALMLLQTDIIEAGPLLNSGMPLDGSKSPPVAPVVRFGPHHEEECFNTAAASMISLADIYREIEDENKDAVFSSALGANNEGLTSVSFASPIDYTFESDSDMDVSASGSSSSEEDDFEIDIESWETAPVSSTSSTISDKPYSLLQRYNSEPQIRRYNDDEEIQEPVFKIPDAPATRRRTSMPLKIKMTSASLGRANSTPVVPSSAFKKSSSSLASSTVTPKCTKKMRVAGSSSASNKGFLSVSVDPQCVITASSPVLTPPHALALPTRKAAPRRGSLGEAGLGLERESVKQPQRASTLSAAISASKKDDLDYIEEVDDEIEEESIDGMEVGAEDTYVPESKSSGTTKRKPAAAPNRKKKAVAATATTSATASAPVKPTPSRPTKKPTPPPGSSSKETGMKLDPDFVRKFKSRAVAEQAALTAIALKQGQTMAELVIERLPKLKEGEEKRLKLGTLSILDPESAEKRFFCPVCRKEYKNANGLKYHLNHSTQSLMSFQRDTTLVVRRRKPRTCPNRSYVHFQAVVNGTRT
ncbi:hypothetical protein BCR33DRAFT_79658 [Rhizoclosmatium globosum]|uniref:C2H2-type domain-containing protein n=1 Tax=Rhizoclosmatium globosum TaxID=329046 RepID=A0A1Y2CLR9_9FUNG|nr:hypothetical protein BCR33DRAFT_79658 [Rhizoclosmatium globosum]|eukprot:ORY47814.1 hypothetical protein BCR33DRAFT_79658 [Rhizoclosmatium globosum]